MSDTTETRLFKVVSVIATGFFAGVSIANAVYYNRVRSGGGCGNLNAGEATTMMWINIIIAVIAVLFFVWSLIRLIFSREVRQQVVNSARTYASGQGSGVVKTLNPNTNQYAQVSSQAASANIISPMAQQEIAAAQAAA